jgi:hypothetical protein
MDRETLMMIATIVAIAGVIFLFKEMNKAKQDVDNLKNFSAHLIQRLTPQNQSVTRKNQKLKLGKIAKKTKKNNHIHLL